MADIEQEYTPPFPEQSQQKPGLDSRMDPRPRNQASALHGTGKLDGQVAMITGGDSGIGAAVSILFAREGADIAIFHLPGEEDEDAAAVKARVEDEGHRCLVLPGDVRDSSACQEAVRRTVAEFGRLDVLVNNAAVMYLRSSLDEITDDEFENLFHTNVLGYYHMARAALPHLRGGGRIVNCGSVAGFLGHPNLLGYAATNGAIHTLTKSLAAGLVSQKVRVNCVAPGPVWTPLNASARTPQQMAAYGVDVDPVPFGRPAQPDEIAPAFLFFASDADSSYITGETLAIYGGGIIGR